VALFGLFLNPPLSISCLPGEIIPSLPAKSAMYPMSWARYAGRVSLALPKMALAF
jgi:hypothetical protein